MIQVPPMIPIIDAHVHFWDREHPDLSWPWLDKDFRSDRHAWTEAARRDSPTTHDDVRYTAADYRAETANAGVLGLVHVHSASAAEDPSQETAWLDHMAEAEGWPLAIVGSGDLTSPDGPGLLRRHHAASAICRGVRDMKGPDGLDPDLCGPSLSVAAELGFVVELRTPPEGFGTLAELADRWPDVTFVLSHAGLPRKRTPETLAEWTAAAKTLAERPNWFCKISALCGGSDPDWTVDSIRPWGRSCLSVFGPDRCMIGTNWPVDRLFGTYLSVVSAMREIFDDLTDGEKRQLFHRNAASLYGIDVPGAGASA
jgi:predicted TIM-barrel fold metal-dependent hydrolase